MNSGETSKRTTIERGLRLVNRDDNEDYSLVATSKDLAVAAIKQKRDQDKLVLNQLNDRFAKYIDRVKFLENLNRKLLAELDELRLRWGEESRLIRERFEPELLEARSAIDDRTIQKAISEIRAKRSEYDTANFKRQHDDALALTQADKKKMTNLEYLLKENLMELDLLKRQMNDAELDINKYKKEVKRLNEDLQRLLSDLDQETLRRVKLENEKQTLEEQIPFLNAIHEHELNELKSLHAGAHIDPAQFYRHELERAIRDIRADFEDLSEQQKRELEEWYRIKTEELMQQAAKWDSIDSLGNLAENLANLRNIFNENQREFADLKQLNTDLIMRLSQLEEKLDKLKNDNLFALDQRDRYIAEIRAKLQELMGDYDELMNNKASLEFEINTYRRLLDSEEIRPARHAAQTYVNKPIAAIMSNVSTTQSSGDSGDYQVTSTEMSSKTTFQRSAKGPISINECTPDGRVIILENTSRNKDVQLTNWVLKRRVDSKDEIIFRFPTNLVIKPNKVIRIWARGQGKENLPTDLVNKEIENWGIGVNVVTIVLNDLGDEKATHIQKTVYAM